MSGDSIRTRKDYEKFRLSRPHLVLREINYTKRDLDLDYEDFFDTEESEQENDVTGLLSQDWELINYKTLRSYGRKLQSMRQHKDSRVGGRLRHYMIVAENERPLSGDYDLTSDDFPDFLRCFRKNFGLDGIKFRLYQVNSHGQFNPPEPIDQSSEIEHVEIQG